jgi:hypothetical protein
VNASASGKVVTFTATVSVVSPGSTAVANPVGKVTFMDGSTVLGQALVTTTGGVTTAKLSTSKLSPGVHMISAVFSDDPNFAPSTGTITQTVNPSVGTVAWTFDSSDNAKVAIVGSGEHLPGGNAGQDPTATIPAAPALTQKTLRDRLFSENSVNGFAGMLRRKIVRDELVFSAQDFVMVQEIADYGRKWNDSEPGSGVRWPGRSAP